MTNRVKNAIGLLIGATVSSILIPFVPFETYGLSLTIVAFAMVCGSLILTHLSKD